MRPGRHVGFAASPDCPSHLSKVDRRKKFPSKGEFDASKRQMARLAALTAGVDIGTVGEEALSIQ